MKKVARKMLAGLALVAMLLPVSAFAAGNMGDWLTIGGDYRFRVDSLKADQPSYNNGFGTVPAQKIKDDTLYTNRFGLNVKAKVMQNVTFNSRLVMYKDFGSQTGNATFGPYFADRSSVNDGTQGHVPSDGQLTVDQAYVTINNIFDQPIWFSVGRRPSTGGLPTHIRQNGDKPGVGGVAGLLVDYAYDGMTLGYAPDIDALPGAYAKFCYGRGYQENIHSNATTSVKNMDMAGIVLVPYDTDRLTLHLQANRGMNIFDNPNAASVNMGRIDQYGVTVMSMLKDMGPGGLNLFASAAMDKAHPNDHTAGNDGSPFGLMNGDAFGPTHEVKTGSAFYLGARYDLPSKTKLGFEYNHGSKNWVAFVPAADDIWTSKLGTRGSVYEGYLIQELPYAPLAGDKAKTFLRLGYQYYDFKYTGSNNWVGAPVAMTDVLTNPQVMGLVPIKTARDLYATLEVKF